MLEPVVEPVVVPVDKRILYPRRATDVGRRAAVRTISRRSREESRNQ